jgi:hypothetical protein
MNFLIQVRWSNGKHQLLQRGDVDKGADIDVIPDQGSSLTGRQNMHESGMDFLIKGASSTITVKVSFKPTIAGNQVEVLSANQVYTVSGGDLVEKTATLDGGSTVTKHPLITLTKQPAATTRRPASPGTTTVGPLATFTVRVNTDFVDATEHWKQMIGKSTTCMAESGSCWDAFTKLKEPGTELLVLGFTGGNPVLWFVVVPDTCKNVSGISSLVFFRPFTYGYTTFDDAQHAKKAMFLVGRYLITARAPDPGVWWAWDRYHDITDDQLATVNNQPSQHYDWLCAGFPNALKKSQKHAILVIPFPSGDEFGAAQGAGLASHLTSIRALLFARGKVGAGQQSVSEGKLALSGYSRGGLGLWKALNANKTVVQEVYCFDCNDDDQHVNDLVSWAGATSGFKLRLAGGLTSHVSNNATVLSQVTARITAGTASGEVTTHPASPSTFYADASVGGSKWWNHVFVADTRFFASAGYNEGTRHQFVIYGGEDTAFAPGAAPGQPWTGVSFMEDFLSKSTL